MQRSAAILLVVLSSLMLGTTPCCRIHDYAGAATDLAVSDLQAGAERGPGEFVCPCCKRTNPKHGTRTSEIARGCECTTLDGEATRTKASATLPLALPVVRDQPRMAPDGRTIAAHSRATDVPRFVE